MHKLKFPIALLLTLTLVLSNFHAAYAADPLALEASWARNTVKITFDSNGGGVPPEYQIYAFGVSRSMPGQCSMRKDGYQFLGWSEDKNATTPTWRGGDTSTEAFGYASETQAVAKTLYAVWSENTGNVAGVVKSIQRGAFSPNITTNFTYTKFYTVNIQAVDRNKSIILLDPLTVCIDGAGDQWGGLALNG